MKNVPKVVHWCDGTGTHCRRTLSEEQWKDPKIWKGGVEAADESRRHTWAHDLDSVFTSRQETQKVYRV